MAKTRIRYEQPTASGKRTGWARTFTAVHDTVRGAKAFDGHYLRHGVEYDLERGTLVLEVYPTGSVKNGRDEARFYEVTEEGLSPVSPDADGTCQDETFEWRGEFLSCVDHAKLLLARKAELKRFRVEVREGLVLFVTANCEQQATDRLIALFVGDGRYLGGQLGQAQAAAHITVTEREIRQASYTVEEKRAA